MYTPPERRGGGEGSEGVAERVRGSGGEKKRGKGNKKANRGYQPNLKHSISISDDSFAPLKPRSCFLTPGFLKKKGSSAKPM